MKFLDFDGLSYFTTKLLAKIPSKISQLTNDLGFTKVNSSTTNGNILIDDKETSVYTLPTASSSALGGVKIGTNVSISNGTISVKDGTTNQKGIVQLTDSTSSTSTTTAATPNSVNSALSSAKSYADDLNDDCITGLSVDGQTITYTKGDGTAESVTIENTFATVETSGSGNAITAISSNNGKLTATKGSTFLTAHPTISTNTDTTSTATASHGGTVTMVDSITRDSNGHVTKINTKTVTLPSGNNAAGSNLGLVKSGGDVTIADGVITVNDDSHNHIISNVDGLQSALDGKASSTHTHDDKYYTESEIDAKFDAIIGTGASETLDTIGEISKAIEDNQDILDTLNSAIGNKANTSDLTSHTGNTTVHVTSTDKNNWNSAKTHADSAHAPSNAEANQNAFSNVTIGSTTISADTKTDTLTLVGSNVTLTPDATNDKVTIGITKDNVTTALGYTPPTTNTIYSAATSSTLGLVKSGTDITVDSSGNVSVNDNSHNHTIANIDNLQTSLDTITSNLNTHTSNTTSHITSTERTNWNAAYTHSTSTHAPSNAEANQNAFSNIKVGSTTVAADSKTDTLELAGSNITITPDATNDKITFTVADGTTSAKGVVQLTDSTSSTSTTTAATPNSVKSAYDLANTAKTTADSKVGSVSLASGTNNGTLKLTVNGTATDNISVKGLGSAAYTASTDYATSGHTHNYAGSSSAGGSANSAVKLSTARTIGISGGATGTATSFDGSANITIPVTSIDPSYIADGYTSKGFYINTHPENSPTIIPFINNDIAYLLKRGGSAIVKYDGVTQNVDISSLFDGSPSYWAINPTNITEVVIELTLHKSFAWTNTVYVDSGANGWRAKNVKLEVINTNYTDDVWTVKIDSTNRTISQFKHTFSHKPVGAENEGGGFNKIRLTFSGWNSSNIFRIAAIGVVNYGSSGLRETFLPKDGGEVFGSISPYNNEQYDLGTSSKKWKNIYANTFTGSLSGNSSTATKLANSKTIQTNLGSTSTASFDGSANITPGVTGTLPIANGGTGATTAAGALTNLGITATAAELNILDGVTATATELNYCDGVTSNIQTQLNGKAASSHGNHVPATETANNAKFLRNDNTWQTVTPANIGAAASSHGTHVTYSTTNPVMDGTASVGTASTVSRSDHVHPTDTSRAAVDHTHNYAGSSSAGGAATTALTCTGNSATATDADKLDGYHATDFQGNLNIHSKINLTSGTFSDCILGKINEGYRSGLIEISGYSPSDSCNGNSWGLVSWLCNGNKFVHLIFYVDRSEVMYVREISFNEGTDTGWHMIGDGCNADTIDGYHESSLAKTGYAGTNLNTIVTSGMYRLSSGHTNAPSGSDWGQLIVSRGGGDTIAQLAFDFSQGRCWLRTGNPPDCGGAGSWTAWRELYTYQNITYGTSALTPNSSSLATGYIYLQYE